MNAEQIARGIELVLDGLRLDDVTDSLLTAQAVLDAQRQEALTYIALIETTAFVNQAVDGLHQLLVVTESLQMQLQQLLAERTERPC